MHLLCTEHIFMDPSKVSEDAPSKIIGPMLVGSSGRYGLIYSDFIVRDRGLSLAETAASLSLWALEFSPIKPGVVLLIFSSHADYYFFSKPRVSGHIPWHFKMFLKH